jgi:hypothetical protein
MAVVETLGRATTLDSAWRQVASRRAAHGYLPPGQRVVRRAALVSLGQGVAGSASRGQKLSIGSRS